MATTSSSATWQRFVALGDSSTEGLDDPDGQGGFRGWADRFAEHVATASPGLLYANLAVRGKAAHEIRESQLAAAVAMKPDLATVVAGMNDLLRGKWDAARVAGEVLGMARALIDGGATVITFTLPDVSRRMRLGKSLSGKTRDLNDELRSGAKAIGALVLDLATYDLAYDDRMWAVDRLHGNPEGHARIATEVAALLGLEGFTPGSLSEQLPALEQRRRDRVVADVAWAARFVAPWAWRRLRGRTLGDGRTAKRPELRPVSTRR